MINQLFKVVNRTIVCSCLMVGMSATAVALAPPLEKQIETISSVLLLAEPTAILNAAQRSLAGQRDKHPSRRFQVTVSPDVPTYQRVDGELLELPEGIAFMLTVLPAPTATVETPAARVYRATVEAAVFDTFWAELQQLGAGELPDATANGPVPGEPGLIQDVSDAPTYQFSVQAQQPFLSHQFQVYGPRHVADPRYRAIVVLFDELVADTFGNEPFAP